MSAVTTQEPSKTTITPAERQVATVEGQTPPAEVAQKTEAISPKFAALARQEKMIRRAREELKQQEAALKAKNAEYETSYINKSKLKESPLSVLAELGISPEDLANQILTQPNQDPVTQKLLSKINELESKVNQTTTEMSTRDKQAYETAIKQLGNEAKILVDSDPSYELIKAQDATGAIVELIEETHKETGVLMSVEEAAKEIENHLYEEALKLSQLEKVKKGLQPPPAVVSEVAETPAIKTLTNAQAGSGRPLTAKERAIMAFQGKLTK